MGTIITKSNKADREITLEAPKVLEMETLKELVAFQGEEMCVNQIRAQLTVGYRAMVRTKLEATDDNGDPTNSDEDIKKIDMSDWKPEPRVRKTAEEKALEALGALDPAVREAVLASFKKGK